mgnify:CR=1 FL=1
MPVFNSLTSPERIVADFYIMLREEIRNGNPLLSEDENALLRSHYETMLRYMNLPPEIAGAVYTARRIPPVREIQKTDNPFVFDAGCGYGSESFLFAFLGTRVVAVDREAQIDIAKKRQVYYENKFQKKLDVEFVAGDLNDFIPPAGLSLTWLASVLAAIPDQNNFLKKVYQATRPGGAVMITDMNILNPLFMFGEWKRRCRGRKRSADFAKNANFWAMLFRKGRIGARYFLCEDGSCFDDVQFFSGRSLSQLCREIGFLPQVIHVGYGPPGFIGNTARALTILNKIPVISELGYFYLVTGYKGGLNVI